MGKVVDGYYEITDIKEAVLFYHKQVVISTEGEWWMHAVRTDVIARLAEEGAKIRVTPPQLWKAIKPVVGRARFAFTDEYPASMAPHYLASDAKGHPGDTHIEANAITLGKRVGQLRELVAFCSPEKK